MSVYLYLLMCTNTHRLFFLLQEMAACFTCSLQLLANEEQRWGSEFIFWCIAKSKNWFWINIQMSKIDFVNLCNPSCSGRVAVASCSCSKAACLSIVYVCLFCFFLLNPKENMYNSSYHNIWLFSNEFEILKCAHIIRSKHDANHISVSMAFSVLI